MTKREKFVAIMNGELDHEALVEFCEAEIAALDKKAEKTRERAAAKRAETDELREVVLSVLTDEFQTREQIAAQVLDENGNPLSVNKIGNRLTALVNAELAVKEKISVEGADGKSVQKMGYKLR